MSKRPRGCWRPAVEPRRIAFPKKTDDDGDNHLPRIKPVFRGLDPDRLASALQTAADLAMVVHPKGKILAVDFTSADLKVDLSDQLRGRRWVETVTQDSRDKVAELLTAGPDHGRDTVVRDVVQLLDDGTELPMRFVRAASFADGRVALLGRDQRAIASLQQQVFDAQMALEQDYWRLRHVETRYRLLFQMAGEPLLIVDEASGRVLESNPLADSLLAPAGKSIVGKPFPIGFDKRGTEALRRLLLEATAVGRATLEEEHATAGGTLFSASATLLRQGEDATFLIRLAQRPAAGAAATDAAACVGGVMRHAPDAIVLTDTEGRVRAANQTFLDMAQLASEEQVVGRSIDRWLGRSGVDLNVLMNNLRQHESVRLFATKLRSEYGTTTDVEISVGPYAEGDSGGFAFVVRDVARRLGNEPTIASRLPRSVDQITQQVGRVPLKELVRQSTDLVEKLCIETALELTGDNRASAAELLGVSRQGLYAKLNRYNLADRSGDS